MLECWPSINLQAAQDITLRANAYKGTDGDIVVYGSQLQAGKGSESGNGVTHTETTVNAGNQLNITSGRDTVLKGSQVSGETVKADVGRDLLLQSQQDSDRYDSKQQDASIGGSFNFGSMTGSASINASHDKMHSNFDSVQEQTGIFAGKGGFDITVGEHTQLDGAVIASTATADKNTLDTGTLGFSNIGNKTDFKVEHQSVGISTGGNIGGQFVGNMANGLLVGANNEGHDNSTTHAAVSDGTITLRDTDKQQQNVADLSRDVEHANNALSPIFDKEKEQNRLREINLIGEIGSQVSDVIRTQGDINGLKAAKEKLGPLKENATEKDRAEYMEKLRNSDVYKDEMKKNGTGSALQQGVQAATAAIQGLAGGDMAKALAGASAPYLAEVIHNMTTDANGKVNVEANLMAHAVLGAVMAQVNGNSALAGASGAVMGEYIAQQMYPGINREDLTEEQRQTISALGTLASGLAGGLAGGSTADAAAGAQAGKNALENNSLGLGAGDIGFWLGNPPDCDTTCKAGIAKGIAEGNLVVSAGIGAVAGGAMIVAATPEIAALAKAALKGCKAEPAICLNNVGLQVAEAVTPGGVGAAGVIGVGKTAVEATAARAGAANAAKNISSGSGSKIDAGKFGQLELDVLSQTGAKADPAVKAGNLTIAGRALQKHGSREGSAFPIAKGTPTQMNEQGQKILDGIVKAPGATVKDGNRFGGFDVVAPDGRGARFDPQGNFRGFLEP
ncbi:TPA: hemagglutinin repeat-containing protein [Yersinia enterocolitica]|nr:hemagglutinin repeat-containing protein [Yersinia enterocolitica]